MKENGTGYWGRWAGGRWFAASRAVSPVSPRSELAVSRLQLLLTAFAGLLRRDGLHFRSTAVAVEVYRFNRNDPVLLLLPPLSAVRGHFDCAATAGVPVRRCASVIPRKTTLDTFRVLPDALGTSGREEGTGTRLGDRHDGDGGGCFLRGETSGPHGLRTQVRLRTPKKTWRKAELQVLCILERLGCTLFRRPLDDTPPKARAHGL